MKNLNQLRLSPSTNLQALADKARRAAAISAVERNIQEIHQTNQPKQAEKPHRLSPLEQSARSISAFISAHSGEDTILINEAPGRYSSAHAIISLYSNADLEAQRVAKERRKKDATVNMPKLCPIIKYVLYSSVVTPTRLGSVAIYCENVRSLHATIAKTGYLFGIPIKNVTLETGLSQYVDVVFRA